MNNKDVSFVNSLFSQANEKSSFKLDAVFFSIFAFFIFAITWASFAYVDELTRGSGKVIPAKKIQNIQNLDGGIISDILVIDGEHVTKGQALMKIDTTRFQASLEENKESYLSLMAKMTRLKAQTKYKYGNRIKSLKFPKELNNKKYSQYKRIESRLYKNKLNEYNSGIKTLNFQLSQKKQELKEIYSKRSQLERSLKLINKQRYSIKRMVMSGSKSKIELLKIEDRYNTAKGDLESTILSIPRAKSAIQESQSTIQERKNKFISESSTKLQEADAQFKTIKARLVGDRDKLDKTIIKSPVNGFIKQINLNTIGGVVKSGESLIEIVPDSDILLIEAKIDPKDIAFINPTQKVIVKLTAYDFSIYGGLKGKIIEISADSIKDKDSKEGKSYYKVVVKTTKNYLERNGEKLPIIPGMVASIDIVTGKKTIMDFILKPILKTKQGALHER